MNRGRAPLKVGERAMDSEGVGDVVATPLAVLPVGALTRREPAPAARHKRDDVDARRHYLRPLPRRAHRYQPVVRDARLVPPERDADGQGLGGEDALTQTPSRRVEPP